MSDGLRAISTANMAVVGIVFTLLLRNEDPGALLPWVNFVLHDLMPCAVVLDWLAEPPAARAASRNLARYLAFPAVYLSYSLVRGSEVGWYPYPFLNPARVGYTGVAAYSAGIAALFLATGWAAQASGNQRRAAPTAT